MRTLTYRDAIREALIEEMRRDPELIVLGEDIIPQGGIFGVHRDLAAMFPERILQTPISEPGFMGIAVGAAMAGGPVVAEVMFVDFITCCMDEIVNQAAKMRYMSGGQARVPLVVRAPCGMGRGTGAQHTQALEAWFAHVPGLAVALPATPADAKGLLKTAIRADGPTIFLEYKTLYGMEGEVSEDPEETIPFGVARIARAGGDITAVATGAMVHHALAAAEALAAEGISLEVIDPRTVSPIDFPAIYASVRRTSRAMVIDEAVQACSVGSEIAASIGEDCFGHLDKPVRRIGSPHVPKPFAPELERLSSPGVADILRVARQLMGRTA